MSSIDTGGSHGVGIAPTRGGARTQAILRLPRELRIGGDEDEALGDGECFAVL